MTIKETYYGPKTTQLKGELWTIKELHDTYIMGPWEAQGKLGRGSFSISLLLALGQQAM